jgi:hypothetical protein
MAIHWETEVVEKISDALEMATSDAQSFLEANNFQMNQANGYDLDPQQAANLIIGKAMGMDVPKSLNKYRIICETGEACTKEISLGACFSLFQTWNGFGQYYYIVDENNNHIFIRNPFDGAIGKIPN